MKYDDIEKTQDLFDLSEDVPSPIENIEMEGAAKDTLTDELTLGLSPDNAEDEVTTSPDNSNAKEEETPSSKNPQDTKKTKPEKKSLKAKWQSLSKKKKILLIASLVLILVALIIALVFLLKGGDEEEKTKTSKPSAPVVIVEEENYKYVDGTLIFLDKDKNELGKYECQNKDEELCYIANYSTEDDFDTPRNVYENNTVIERRSTIYNDNYVFIYDNKTASGGVSILYNIAEEKEEGTYTTLKGYSDSNYIILKDASSKYGAIEITEDGIKERVSFSYDYLGMLDKKSNLVAKTSDKYYIYNLDGKALSKGLAYEIKSYNKNYIVVDDNGYYVYDYKGNLIFDDKFDYISLLDDYALLIDNELLYVRDYKGNKYNEEGIDLKSSNYNETNVYDKDKTLIETKYAFKVDIEEAGLSITYKNKNSEKNKIINPYEGKLSANLAFMNYFDSTLYFYNDEEKTELLGKYTCTNKNIIDKNTTKLTNCTIATESFYSKNGIETDNSANLGLLPVYNNRFVFIADSIDLNKPTISLYDLEASKTMVKYNSVDAGLYSKEQNLTFANADEFYIMAENRSNKYGVIKITDKVSGLIAFEYNNIQKLRDYYLGKTSQDSYVLLNNSGKAVTEKLGREIIDYNGTHLKTFKDNKYYVCDFKGNTNNDTGYLDITLGDDYYVFITNNYELGISKYDSKTVSTSLITIGTNYKDNYTVTKNNAGEFTVTIKSSNETYKANSEGIFEKDQEPSIPGTPSA